MPKQRDQLFVKVDGYQAVLEELEAVKQVMEQMQDALDVIREIRDVKAETITVFLDHIDDLNNRLENIARELPDVEDTSGIQPPSQTSSAPSPQSEEAPRRSGSAVEDEVIENSVKDLHQELRRLKNSLRDLEK